MCGGGGGGGGLSDHGKFHTFPDLKKKKKTFLIKKKIELDRSSPSLPSHLQILFKLFFLFLDLRKGISSLHTFRTLWEPCQ